MNILTTARQRIARSRRTVALAVAGLAVVVPMITAAAPAQASTTSVYSVNGTCDRYTHQMSVGASLMLSDAYPNGTTVAVHYAYWSVDAAGNQLTAVTYTPWQYIAAKPGSIHVGDMTIGQYTTLPAYSRPITGYLRSVAQMGIWNGRTYDYTAWARPDAYTNLGGQFQIYRSTGSVCIAS